MSVKVWKRSVGPEMYVLLVEKNLVKNSKIISKSPGICEQLLYVGMF